MPVRNAERTVARAIDSILGQTCRELEFIIVDNGSTDGTRHILERAAAADARVVLASEPVPGIVPALNLGLARASGRFIARMDADDVASPHRIESQLCYLDAHPEIGVVGTGIVLADEDGTETEIELPTEPAEIAARLTTLDRFWVVAHPSVVMRAELLREVGGYRGGFPYAEDLDLWLRLAERSAIANLPDALLRYDTAGMRARSLPHRSQQLRSIACARWAALSRRQGDGDPFGELPPDPSDEQIDARLGTEGPRFWLDVLYLLCAQTFTAEERGDALSGLLARLSNERTDWFLALPWDVFVLSNLDATLATSPAAQDSWLVAAAEQTRRLLEAATDATDGE